MTIRLILVGCGNLGYAMLNSWLNSGKLAASETFVIEPNAELHASAAELGSRVASEVTNIPIDAKPEIIVLAVKPQVIREVTYGYRRFGECNTTFVSVAAGVPVSTFAEILGAKTPIVRCMPNTPAAIGKGMMVLFSNNHVTDDTKVQIVDLLSAGGKVATIADEGLMDAVTAVSGSGPAYIFYFIESLTAAAEHAGLLSEMASLLAIQTVYGAACLAAESRKDPAVLRRQVTSPNGATAAALNVLMGEDRLKNLLTDAIEAARLRSIELGK